MAAVTIILPPPLCAPMMKLELRYRMIGGDQKTTWKIFRMSSRMEVVNVPLEQEREYEFWLQSFCPLVNDSVYGRVFVASE